MQKTNSGHNHLPIRCHFIVDWLTHGDLEVNWTTSQGQVILGLLNLLVDLYVNALPQFRFLPVIQLKLLYRLQHLLYRTVKVTVGNASQFQKLKVKNLEQNYAFHSASCENERFRSLTTKKLDITHSK